MRVKPGLVCAAVLVIEALVMDVFLHKMGQDSISTCVRENQHSRRAVRWGSAHLTDTIQGDLLSLLAKAVLRARLV